MIIINNNNDEYKSSVQLYEVMNHYFQLNLSIKYSVSTAAVSSSSGECMCVYVSEEQAIVNTVSIIYNLYHDLN